MNPTATISASLREVGGLRRTWHLDVVHVADEHLVVRLLIEDYGPARQKSRVTTGDISVPQIKILRGIVVSAGADDLRSLRDILGLGQTIAGLPVENIIWHGKERLPCIIRVNHFEFKPIASEMHVGFQIEKHDIRGQ